MSANYVLPENALGRFTASTDWTYILRSYTIIPVPNAPNLFNERLNVEGTTRWRGSATLSWRKGPWNASTSAYYIGKFQSTGATTTEATYLALGSPSWLARTYTNGAFAYRYLVKDTVTMNATVGYAFRGSERAWLRNLSVRASVINLADVAPPISNGAFGYTTSVYGNLLQGRTWTLELSKRF